MNRTYFTLLVIIFFISCTAMTACYRDNEQDLYGTTTCDTTSVVKFSTVISPLISSKCGTSGCHSTSSKAAGVDLGNYDAIKAYITASKASFLGTINHASGYSAMPKGDNKLSDCSISNIGSWITAGLPNN